MFHLLYFSADDNGRILYLTGASLKAQADFRAQGVILPAERVERRLAAVLAADIAG